LNIIVGELKADKGQVIWESGVTHSYLDQQL
jgi:ATPase subunit of ABC transporter with duplicated ATPase domains